MKVHWTDIAVEHLLAIHEYIAKDSPEYALRIVDRLTRRSQQIAEFPRSGRSVPELQLPDIREVIEGPYRIVYRILENQVDVIAFSIHRAAHPGLKHETANTSLEPAKTRVTIWAAWSVLQRGSSRLNDMPLARFRRIHRTPCRVT